MTEKAHNGLAERLEDAVNRYGFADMAVLREAIAALRSPQPAEQQEAVAIICGFDERGPIVEWLKDFRGSKNKVRLYAHSPSVAPREAQQAKPVAWLKEWSQGLCKRVDLNPEPDAWMPSNLKVTPLYAAPSEGAQRDAEQLADETVNDWNQRGLMPEMAWDFRGLVADGIRRALSRRPA